MGKKELHVYVTKYVSRELLDFVTLDTMTVQLSLSFIDEESCLE